MQLLFLSIFSNLIFFCSCQLEHIKWAEFKLKNNKNYRSKEEENFRFNIFKANLKLINEHNSQFKRGLTNFTMAVNKLADKTTVEINRIFNGYNGQVKMRTQVFKPNAKELWRLPESIDWRDNGWVTGVKDQGQCGSCWAFSATGALEGQFFNKTATLTSFSEQNLLDCTLSYGNRACNGGFFERSFEYVAKKGIATEESYPYKARLGVCKSRVTKQTGFSGYVSVKSGSENALTQAIAEVGPISVAIDAGNPSFHFYESGVYEEPNCSQTILNHAVLAVGYGVNTNQEQFYVVKNSWGLSWGMDGYILMARNKDNNCGIATAPAFPII